MFQTMSLTRVIAGPGNPGNLLNFIYHSSSTLKSLNLPELTLPQESTVKFTNYQTNSELVVIFSTSRKKTLKVCNCRCSDIVM